MPRVPPAVHAELIGGVAYLLGWERAPASEGGGWNARIGWVEYPDDSEAWVLKGSTVPADMIRRLPDQDYSQVPRDSDG
jgi:hypothetical protein